MTIEQRMADALLDLDGELARGASVASAIADVSKSYGISASVLRTRAERQFGALPTRKRWHLLKARSRQDVAEFLAEHPVNSDWDSLFIVEWRYESFLSTKYKKKVSEQRRILAHETLEAAYKIDLGAREADRKARGVRRVRW